MGRWAPNAHGRLELAALELYREHGFDSTTVAEIAERAGLAERTFFRYFTDKREVLFWGSGALQDFLVRNVDRAPASRSPIVAIAAALVEAASVIFESVRGRAETRDRCEETGDASGLIHGGHIQYRSTIGQSPELVAALRTWPTMWISSCATTGCR